MTRKLDIYWRSNPDWWEYNDKDIAVVKSSAPPEAQESFKRYWAAVTDPALEKYYAQNEIQDE